MTKPVIKTRVSNGVALTYAELDTNFTNLRDATIGVSDGTNTHQFNLNDTIQFTAGSNVTLSVNPTTGAITIAAGNSGNNLPRGIVYTEDTNSTSVQIGRTGDLENYLSSVGQFVIEGDGGSITLGNGAYVDVQASEIHLGSNNNVVSGGISLAQPLNVLSLTTTQRNYWASNYPTYLKAGSVIYNSTTNTLQFYNGSSWADANGTNYTLPAATRSTLGGVKIGANLTLTSDGTIGVDTGAGYTLPQATTSTLGGIIVGARLSISNGVLSADVQSAGAAAAGTLTGTTLASNVVTSSLTSVGTLSSLTTSGTVTLPNWTFSANSLNATNSTTSNIVNTLTGTVNLANAATDVEIGSTTTDNQTVQLACGSTANGKTKTLNLGTNGSNGSTTNVMIGSYYGSSYIWSQNTYVSGALSVTPSTGHSFFVKVQTAFNAAFDTSLAMDNLNVRIHGVSGSSGKVQMSAVSGSFNAYVTIITNVAGQNIAGDTNALGITFTAGTWSDAVGRYNLSSGGDFYQAHVTDYSNSRIYRVTAIHCQGTTGGYISIERMV